MRLLNKTTEDILVEVAIMGGHPGLGVSVWEGVKVCPLVEIEVNMALVLDSLGLTSKEHLIWEEQVGTQLVQGQEVEVPWKCRTLLGLDCLEITR